MAGEGGLIVVLTGAGISAESGLPTFRGAGGLWEGHRVEEVATPEASVVTVWTPAGGMSASPLVSTTDRVRFAVANDGVIRVSGHIKNLDCRPLDGDLIRQFAPAHARHHDIGDE